jgi:hypothetical protein
MRLQRDSPILATASCILLTEFHRFVIAIFVRTRDNKSVFGAKLESSLTGYPLGEGTQRVRLKPRIR